MVKMKEKNLILRRNGKYYQIGYYEDRRWIQVEHLGTIQKILKLVRQGKDHIEKSHTKKDASPKSEFTHIAMLR